MANQFTIYTSADASAPVLAVATPGSLIAVLDACLVNGYGSKVAAGWAKAFSGTNLAAYRAATGVRHYVRIDNTGTSGIIPISAYETMSDVNTGTGNWLNGKILAPGSTWVVVADAVTFYLFISNGGGYYGICFGEFYSFVSNDSFRSIMVTADFSSISITNSNNYLDVMSNRVEAGMPYWWIARGHTGFGGGINASPTSDYAKTNAGALSLPTPNPADGGIYISPVWLGDPTTAPANGVRGRMRGLWHWLHNNSGVSDRDTISGTGDLAGKTFLVIKPNPSAGLSGCFNIYLIETSATLETN